MNIIRQEIRTGLLVVFTLAVLATMVLYLGMPGVFTPLKTFYIYVDNAAGVKQGADVAVAGRKIGQVVKLVSPVPEAERPDPKKEAMFVVKVAKDAKVFNRVTVSITSNGALGESFLDFTEGVEASGVAQDGVRFVGVKTPGLADAVPAVLERLDPALKKATETLDSLQKTAENLTKLTSPDGEVVMAVAEFRKTGGNLNELSGKDGSLHKTLDNLAALTAPDGTIHKAVDNIATLTSGTGSLANAMKNAERFTGDLATNKDLRLTLENSRRATAELNTTLTELRFKFSAIAGNLEDATDTVKRQPWRLIWPSTKKYPEKQAIQDFAADNPEAKPKAKATSSSSSRRRR